MNEYLIAIYGLDDNIKYYHIEKLIEYLKISTINPETNENFTNNEILYFNFVYNKYLFLKNYLPNKNDLKNILLSYFSHCGNIKESWNFLKLNYYYNYIRYSIEIYDMVDHFKDYKPDKINTILTKYERNKSEKALSYSNENYWLIRKSSLNRNINKNKNETFYAITIKTNDNFIHLLIIENYGWYIRWSLEKQYYYTCFIDMLEYITIKYNLSLVNNISNYNNDD